MAQQKTIIEAHKRMTLDVTQVYQEEPVGQRGSVKLSFKAIGEDGGETKYATFTKDLFPTIKGAEGQSLDCDVEISEHPYGGQIYQDRIVLQVFVNGKGIHVEQPKQQGAGGGIGWKGGGGGGGYREDSPEKIASIEGQTCFNGITALLAQKLLPMEGDLGQLWQKYAKQGMETALVTRLKVANRPAPKTDLVTAAKAAGAVEEPEEIDWDNKTTKPKFDANALADAMMTAKWKDSTLKSWCKTAIKTDAAGQPLNVNLELIPFVSSMSAEGIEKLFKQLESKKAG